MEPHSTNPLITFLAAVVSSLGSILVTWLLSAAKAKRREKAVFSGLMEDIRAIKGQVFANGGSSLRDVCNRIERTINLECERNRAYRYHDKNAYWECNEHGSILWCNPAMAKLWGVSKQELLNNAWMMMVHEQDIKRVRDELHAGAEYGHNMLIDFRVHRPSRQTLLKLRTHWRSVNDPLTRASTGYVGTVVSYEEVPQP